MLNLLDWCKPLFLGDIYSSSGKTSNKDPLWQSLQIRILSNLQCPKETTTIQSLISSSIWVVLVVWLTNLIPACVSICELVEIPCQTIWQYHIWPKLMSQTWDETGQYQVSSHANHSIKFLHGLYLATSHFFHSSPSPLILTQAIN